VRSLLPDKALRLPIASLGFMGQRRQTSLPPRGRPLLSDRPSIRERIAEFRFILIVSRAIRKLFGIEVGFQDAAIRPVIYNHLLRNWSF